MGNGWRGDLGTFMISRPHLEWGDGEMTNQILLWNFPFGLGFRQTSGKLQATVWAWVQSNDKLGFRQTKGFGLAKPWTWVQGNLGLGFGQKFREKCRE